MSASEDVSNKSGKSGKQRKKPTKLGDESSENTAGQDGFSAEQEQNGSDDCDSEAEELDRLIQVEKDKIIAIKKRRLEKLRKVSRENENSENEEDGTYTDGQKSTHKSKKKKKPKTKSKPAGICTQTSGQDGGVKGMENINLARNNADLEDLKAQLAKFKVGELFDNDNEQDDDSYSDSSGQESEYRRESRGSVRKRRTVGKAKLTSGLFRGSSMKVKREVLWPMDKLGPQHTNYGKQIFHKDLDMRLLVLGEMAIIRDSATSESETNARMDLLNEIIFNAEHFEWSALLRLHAAVLREVEIGNLKWGESYVHMSQLILAPFPKRKAYNTRDNNSERSRDKLWYCKDYNTTSCSLPDKHTITLPNGNCVEACHICSTCYYESKEQANHSSKSDDCPRK